MCPAYAAIHHLLIAQKHTRHSLHCLMESKQRTASSVQPRPWSGVCGLARKTAHVLREDLIYQDLPCLSDPPEYLYQILLPNPPSHTMPNPLAIRPLVPHLSS